MAWNSLQNSVLLANHIGNAVNKESEEPISVATDDTEQSLVIKRYCTKLREKNKVSVVLELECPAEDTSRNMYGRQRREQPTPRSPVRVVLVLDVSHSMSEPHGPSIDNTTNSQASSSLSSESPAPLSKLDRVKLFVELLIKTIRSDDMLSVVTFGTTARVVLPLRRMSDDAKKEALEAVKSIEVSGVTNMSAGVFTAIDQFNVAFAKSRTFDDNIILFTDGMANEGVSDSAELLCEINKRVDSLRDDCHFQPDYVIKFSTLGTGGFLPELVYDIGQAFSSDPFYFLDDRMSMEMDLMSPFLLRQTAAVSNVHVTVTSLNRVQLDRSAMSKDYIAKTSSESVDANVAQSYLIYDIAKGLSRHIVCPVIVPSKHKKALKGKDVLKVDVSYRDSLLSSRTAELTVPYADLPAKEAQNDEDALRVTARQKIRCRVVGGVSAAAVSVGRLDRSSAINQLRSTVDDLRNIHDSIMDDLGEESRLDLTEWLDAAIANVEYCQRFVGDLAVRWDDAWGRLKALESSISREVPTSAAVYAAGSELYQAPSTMKERMVEVSTMLKDMYVALGLETDVLEQYQNVVEELQEKIVDEQTLYT